MTRVFAILVVLLGLTACDSRDRVAAPQTKADVSTTLTGVGTQPR